MNTRSKYALALLAAGLLAACTQPTEPDPPPPTTTHPQPTGPAATPVPQPTAAPPSTTARMGWSLTDGCNDGRGIGVKLFDKTNNQVWPNASQQWTAGPGGSVDVTISCQRGAQICYGAATDPRTSTYWGVSVDGNRGCDTCCFQCGDFQVTRTLVCS